MDLFRPAIVLPLCVSLGLHVGMGWSVARHWNAPSKNTEPIQISYAESRTESHEPPKPVLKKKFPAIQVPRFTPKKEAVSEPEPTDFQKDMETALKRQQRLLSKLDGIPPGGIQPVEERAKSSAEILADPKKGKIFVGYFGEVRRKIQETLSERYAHRYSVRGGVALGFILNAQGFIDQVAVLGKGTDGDERLQELAVQCLRESAPFGPFPAELGSDRIAFNVTLYFVDR